MADGSNAKIICMRLQIEQMLHNAVLMTQMAMELKDRTFTGEKYVCYLRSLSLRAGKIITAIQNSGRSSLLMAQKLCLAAVQTIDEMPYCDQTIYNIKLEYERLLTVLEKELVDIEDENMDLTEDISNISLQATIDKIRYLETKQKQAEFFPPTSSTKINKSDVDEKYPENWSKESLIDLNNVINLPPVPEDIFTSFNKPQRTSSLSSLKNLRKVKLYLQRAASSTSDDDEESEVEEQEIGRSLGLCPSEIRTSTTKTLGNITEEVQEIVL